MNYILTISGYGILTLVMLGIFPIANSYIAGTHERYLHCPYPSSNANSYTEFYIMITKESDTKSCKQNNSCYRPPVLVVNCNSKVTWQNDDTAIHLISSGSQDDGPDGWFASRIMNQNESYSFVFELPGIYSYYDPLHSWATGTVLVMSGENNTDSEWLKFVMGPNCTLGEPNCTHPSLR